MADISLMQNDSSDDSDEGVYVGTQTEDKFLSALQRIQRNALSDDTFNRQKASQIIAVFFKSCPSNVILQDLPQIVDLVNKLANDELPIVRVALLQEVPNLISYVLHRSNTAAELKELKTVIDDHLLPIVLRNFSSDDSQVRRIAHSSLFALLDQKLLTRQQVKIQVCPIVLALSEMDCTDSADYHSYAVTLMSKMALFLGRKATEKMFLKKYAQLCSNRIFYVRKLCAVHMGTFCAVVGGEAYEKVLLPCYLALCEDDIWGVRKVCAEVILSVSCACPTTKRITALAPAFVSLLQDQNRWVRVSAYLTLGPFISTFADPIAVNMSYNEEGELVLMCNGGTSEFDLYSTVKWGNMRTVVRNPSLMDLWMGELEDEDDNDVFDWGDVLFGVDSNERESSQNKSVSRNEEIASSVEQLEKKKEEAFLQKSFEVVSKAIFGENVRNASVTDSCEADAVPVSNSDSEDIKEIVETVKNAVLSFRNECNSGDIVSECQSMLDPQNHCDSSEKVCDCKENINNGCDSPDETEEDNLKEFQTFNYWYVSPEAIVDLGSLEAEMNLNQEEERFNLPRHINPVSSILNLDKSDEERIRVMTSTPKISDNNHKNINRLDKLVEVQKEGMEPSQYLVPQILIDHFISMTDPNVAKNTEDEMAYLCAYSLPAVVLTLGNKNWHLLKPTVEILAANMQYKVRRSVASSLHELAMILGPEIASNDLAPIFEDFFKDLDEVRIGILKHLAHFLRLIHPSKRSLYLPRLADFLTTDSEVNWRFRQELAQQLLYAVPLFRPSDASKHMTIIAQELLCDKVAAVREVALHLVADLLKHISVDRVLTTRLLAKFTEMFAHSKKWKLRQSFALLCAEIISIEAIEPEKFASEVMPHLVDLSWDPVANVRLVVARTISQKLITHEYFANERGLQTVLWRLNGDKDRDVRQFAIQSKDMLY